MTATTEKYQPKVGDKVRIPVNGAGTIVALHGDQAWVDCGAPTGCVTRGVAQLEILPPEPPKLPEPRRLAIYITKTDSGVDKGCEYGRYWKNPEGSPNFNRPCDPNETRYVVTDAPEGEPAPDAELVALREFARTCLEAHENFHRASRLGGKARRQIFNSTVGDAIALVRPFVK